MSERVWCRSDVVLYMFIFITVRHSARDDAAMIITYYCTVRVRVQYV